MNQNEKELLLKDLCSRLPYGVKVESVFINPDTKEHKSCGIEVFDATSILMIRDGLGEFKPYLFPLSSMSEEKIEELLDIVIPTNNGRGVIEESNIGKYMDWCYKNHFDYIGLIEKGLAIDATGLNIY